MQGEHELWSLEGRKSDEDMRQNGMFARAFHVAITHSGLSKEGP